MYHEHMPPHGTPLSRLRAYVTALLLALIGAVHAETLCSDVTLNHRFPDEDVPTILNCVPRRILFLHTPTDRRAYADWEPKRAVYTYNDTVTVTNTHPKLHMSRVESNDLGPWAEILSSTLGSIFHTVKLEVPASEAGSIDLWMRDHFFFTVRLSSGAQILLRPKNFTSKQTSQPWNALKLPSEELGLFLQGGAIVFDGRGRCAMTDISIIQSVSQSDKSYRTVNTYLKRMSQSFGCSELWLLRAGPESTGHIDTIFRFLPPTCDDQPNILFSQWAPFRSDESLKSHRQSSVLNDMAQNLRFVGHHTEDLHLITSFGALLDKGLPTQIENYVLAAYANAYLDGKTAFVSEFGVSDFAPVQAGHTAPSTDFVRTSNQSAQKVFRDLGFNVTTVKTPWIKRGGGLRCVTNEVFCTGPFLNSCNSP